MHMPANSMHMMVSSMIRLLLTSSTRCASMSARLSDLDETWAMACTSSSCRDCSISNIRGGFDRLLEMVPPLPRPVLLPPRVLWLTMECGVCGCISCWLLCCGLATYGDWCCTTIGCGCCFTICWSRSCTKISGSFVSGFSCGVLTALCLRSSCEACSKLFAMDPPRLAEIFANRIKDAQKLSQSAALRSCFLIPG